MYFTVKASILKSYVNVFSTEHTTIAYEKPQTISSANKPANKLGRWSNTVHPKKYGEGPTL